MNKNNNSLNAENIVLNVTINAAKPATTNKVNVSLLKALKLSNKEIQDIIDKYDLVVDYSDVYEMSDEEILNDRSAQMSLYLLVSNGDNRAVEKLLAATDSFIEKITIRISNNSMVAADPAIDSEDVRQDCIVEFLDILAKGKYDPCKKNRAALSNYAYSTMDKNVFRKNRKGTPVGQSDFFYNTMPKFTRWIEAEGNSLNTEADYARCAEEIKETVGTVKSLYSRYVAPPTIQSLDIEINDSEESSVPLVDTLPDTNGKTPCEICLDAELKEEFEEALQELPYINYIIVKSRIYDRDITYKEIAKEVYDQLEIKLSIKEIKDREAESYLQLKKYFESHNF